MKDRFEYLNKKKNKEMRKMCQQEGLEVQKGKPGRKKKAPYPSAVIPAIPKGVTEDTYGEQKRRISVEWNKSKKDYNLLRDLMTSIFPMRRCEILTKNLRVWQFMEDFPNFGSSSGNEVWKYNANQTVNAC